MQSAIELLPITPSMEQLARIIGSIAAPAFLLGAVASFISVVFSQINRVIDRSHYIHAIKDDDANEYVQTLFHVLEDADLFIDDPIETW